MKAAHITASLKPIEHRRSYIYIAGPYSGRDNHGNHGYMVIEQNILNARAAMKDLVNLGYGVFCPHTHSAHFEIITPEVDIDYWYELDVHFLWSCHALLRLPGYSSGADKEVALCLDNKIPVFYTIMELCKEVPIHRPQQEYGNDILHKLRTGQLIT